ncbi:keratin-associated protein family, partial [Trichomonas vaginalis G3]|uniref:keratin-associated protein family n=1 Tax=Trichomonas vaginalis (strain ATCC PRA-98 / G3) TaxID=412133 RepID=UPI0021E5E6F1
MSGTDDLTDYLYLILAELAKKVEENKNNGGRTALKIADKADKSYVDEEIRKVASKEYTLSQSVILKTIKGPEKDIYPGDGTTVKVNERVSFPSGIDAKEVYINSENINTTLIPLKNNEFTEPLTVKSIRSREDKPVIINKIGADNDQPVQIKKIRADDIILNYTLGSSAPQEDPSTSVKDTLNSLDSKCTNIEGHARNFEVYELPAMLDKKADKNHVHYISSDEQIITDYHGYLTRSDEAKTKNVNERRYKYIRAKGYDISCTVQYDVAKAPEAFGYTGEIYASTFNVNGVLVEPRFTLRVKAKITFEDAIKSKADKTELEAMNKVLKSHKHNISDINELQATLDSKADKNHTNESFTTVRADDIILNFDLGSSAPLENPSTSVKDTLNNLDKSCRNIEDHARNFEAYELPAMLDKKADKTYVDAELTKKFSKPDTMTFTTEIINGEPATPFEFVRGLQPDTFEFFLDNSIELTLHYKSGTNATFHPGDTFQMVFNDISSLEYVYRVMSIYDLIYPIGAVYT